MKFIFQMAVGLICLSQMAEAQNIFLHKKIAQRRSSINSTTGSWQGLDSVVWVYNALADSAEISSLMYINNGWEPIQKNTYYYNPNAKLSQYIRQTWTGTQWQNTAQYNYTYNASNAITELLKNKWTANAWVPDLHTINTYTPTNKLAQSTVQNMVNSNWQNIQQDTYTYDVVDSVATKEIYLFASNNFINGSKTKFAWSSNGISQIENYNITKIAPLTYQYLGKTNYLYQGPQLPNMVFSSDSLGHFITKTEYSYNTSNLPQETLTYSGDTLGNWHLETKQTLAYTTNKDIQAMQHFVRLGNTWQPDSSITYTYNSYQKPQNIQYFGYNAGVPMLMQADDYFYNSDTNLIKYQKNTHINGTMQLSHEALYYYAQNATAIKNVTQSIMAQAYPNPSTGLVYLQISQQQGQQAHTAIYNLHGQMLAASTEPILSSSHTLTVDISPLPAGQYILKTNIGLQTLVSPIQKK